MSEVEIKFIKTDEDAVLPVVNHPDPLTGDAGFDLTSVEDAFIAPGCSAVVPVGLQLGYMTPGYWFKIESRSGLSFKHGILAHPGIIDNGYRGDLGVKLYNHGHDTVELPKGSRIAQAVVYKMHVAEVGWTDEADDTDRGGKGKGSSGI